MHAQIAPVILTLCALAALPAAGGAQTTPSGLAPTGGSTTFRFTTSVQTPKGTHSGAGTIVIKRTGTRTVDLTIDADGKAPQTIPLIIGIDGSVARDPDGPAAPTSTDPEAKAQAQAFMAAMTVAARVGIGARKNAGAASYSVPIKLTPVGTGTPISNQMTMTGSAAQYVGSATGVTTTQLPAGGSLDPQQIAKTVGVAAVAHGFTPAGRAATMVVMHHKRKEEKAAASGLLTDTMSMTVTADLDAGQIKQIRGTQTDDIAIPDKPAKVESNWTFTKV